jgi:hypothetical protein
MVDSATMALCVVSYVDVEGIRHSVEVQAESLYEAAVMAMRTFQLHALVPAETSRLQVEIRTSVTHDVTVAKVRRWLEAAPKSPKDALLKVRLRDLL